MRCGRTVIISVGDGTANDPNLKSPGFHRASAELILHERGTQHFSRGVHVSRFWLMAGMATIGVIELIRRRYMRLGSEPKMDEVSTDWLAYARSKGDNPD
jgi:hypothetical protein